MSLTKAERRVVAALDNGGQLWLVADCDVEDPADDPKAHYIVAEFAGDELAGTWRPQRRTVVGLLCKGRLPWEDFAL